MARQAPGGGRLIIVSGLPGTGKTTLASRLEGELGAVRLAADDWMDALAIDLWDGEARARIEALQWTLAQRLLALGEVVIIEWGTWARAERDALRERAHALGAAVELRYLSAPVDVLFDRVRQRDREQPRISHKSLVDWAGMFEEPTADELALYDGPMS